jgi:putative hydrolase of HD superfamily
VTEAERLAAQLSFLLEADRVKSVMRRSYLTDASRREGDAEHMWHLALFVLVLAEHADGPIDVGKVLTMALIHDLVEIDVGDIYVYDVEARLAAVELEQAAAERIFGLLPPDQGDHLRSVWEEFEAKTTPEARFAAALDRLQPLLQNLAAGGRTWAEAGTTAEQVRTVNGPIASASPRLWDHVQQLVADAEAAGLFVPKA